MNEDFVTYEQAIKLKELGFDWKCIHWYRVKAGHNLGLTCIYDTHNTSEKGIPSPTLAHAQKWFREKGLVIIPCVTYIEDIMKYEFYIAGEPIDLFDDSECYDTYEEALSAGIDKALEIINR